MGVEISSNKTEILSKANIIIQLSLLSDENLSNLKEYQTFIGVLNPHTNKEKIENLSKKNINFFSLEMLPRITRAQSMDILGNITKEKTFIFFLDKFSIFSLLL